MTWAWDTHAPKSVHFRQEGRQEQTLKSCLRSHSQWQRQRRKKLVSRVTAPLISTTPCQPSSKSYLQKTQLGYSGFVARVEGAKEPKTCVYHVATSVISCKIAQIALKYQVLARGKVLNPRVASCSDGPGISYLSALSCKTRMPFPPSLCITHQSGCSLTALTWICHFTTNSCRIPGLLPYNCFIIHGRLQ